LVVSSEKCNSLKQLNYVKPILLIKTAICFANYACWFCCTTSPLSS